MTRNLSVMAMVVWGWSALGLLATEDACNTPPAVTPRPDSGDGSPTPVPNMLDASAYAACCAAMHDDAATCPMVLAVVAANPGVQVLPQACAACGVGCP